MENNEKIVNQNERNGNLFRYVIEFRKQKKNVKTFGLTEWYEAIVLWCSFDYMNKYHPEKYKVMLNLGKVKSKKNQIETCDKRNIVKTRPSNMFEDLESMIDSAVNVCKSHYFENKNSIGNEFPEIILYSAKVGIKQIIELNNEK